MRWFPANVFPEQNVIRFILIFYTVAVVGFALPWLRPYFILLTPLALCLSFYLMAVYHNSFSRVEVAVVLLIALSGYGIEVVGVQSGRVFGNYHYGEALGLKVFDTPLIIGFNWLLLTYTSLSLANRLFQQSWRQLLAAPTIMLVYDIIVEQVAPYMDMWYWSENQIPIQNYIAWWFIGFLFVSVLKLFKISTQNPLAIPIFMAQFGFFSALLLLEILGV